MKPREYGADRYAEHKVMLNARKLLTEQVKHFR